MRVKSHAFLVFIVLSLLSGLSQGKDSFPLPVSVIVVEFWCCCFSEVTVAIDYEACRMKKLSFFSNCSLKYTNVMFCVISIDYF